MKIAIAILAVLLVAADAPKKIETFKSKADIDAFVPKELWGTENAAKGERFNADKLNDWLHENTPGQRLRINVRFGGVANEVPKIEDGEYLKASDAGSYSIPIDMPGLTGAIIVPASKKEWVESWKKGAEISGIVTLRVALYRSSETYAFIADATAIRVK